jgi:DNA-binding MarR family transcriptional regulator
MDSQSILMLEKRRKIYNFILKNPGLHLMEISRRMNIPKSTLTYHIHYLKKQGLIYEKNGPYYLRYFISNNVGNDNKTLLKLLRQKIPSQILLMIFWHAGSTLSEISREIGKHPTTIAYHLKKLKEKGVIKKAVIGDNVVYCHWRNCNGVIHRKAVCNETIYILESPQKLYDVLIMFKESLFDDMILEPVLYCLENEIPFHKRPIHINSVNKAFDNVFKLIYDIFPPPFMI